MGRMGEEWRTTAKDELETVDREHSGEKWGKRRGRKRRRKRKTLSPSPLTTETLSGKQHKKVIS